MKYSLNGKAIRIPDTDIERSVKTFGITKDEAIQMWLEDEGYLDNEEQEELERKAKENRITATIHQAKSTTEKQKTQKERVQKADPTKEEIIKEVANLINTMCGNAEITNKTKLIAFELNGEKFELNLIRKRKPKEK